MIALEDILLAGRTLYGEGRSEPYDGLKAIAHVLINRTDRRVGDADHSLAATALRHRQFSAWNEGDPNRPKLRRITLNNPAFRRCLRAMLEALDEPDFTGGARHYMTKARRARGWPRSWGPVRAPCYIKGKHLFFNDVK